MTDRIALLGWGSLVWEGRPEFDALHGAWLTDGPVLMLEFSRISTSRHGALTLVIDDRDGVPIVVAHCLSLRTDLAQAIEDLRAREGTTIGNIGNLRRSGEGRCRDQEAKVAILGWLAHHEIDAVVWTDLASNFAEKRGAPFSVQAALAHLDTLDPPTRAQALEYIERAPPFVRTPLRAAVEK